MANWLKFHMLHFGGLGSRIQSPGVDLLISHAVEASHTQSRRILVQMLAQGESSSPKKIKKELFTGSRNGAESRNILCSWRRRNKQYVYSYISIFLQSNGCYVLPFFPFLTRSFYYSYLNPVSYPCLTIVSWVYGSI